MALTYEVVPEAEVETMKKRAGRDWVQPLLDGQTLKMNKRPQWSQNDIINTGHKLKTKAVPNTDDGSIYVWLTPVTDDINGAAPESNYEYPPIPEA